MTIRTIDEIANAPVAPASGIFAADESDGTNEKRLRSVGAKLNGGNRFEETIGQSLQDGGSFPRAEPEVFRAS